MNMTQIDKTARIKELENQIKYHNLKYFIDNKPEIKDEDFDKLTEELKSLDPFNSVLFELVGEIGEIQHPTPMLSLEKRYSHEDIIKWLKDIGDTKYLVEPKYDGMAARYQNGKLVTRGNGLYGEDISQRLTHLNIIGQLPKDPQKSIYGEVIIPLTYFNENLKSTYKNPRNAVVGIIKSKEVSIEGIKALNDGGIHFVLHDQAIKYEVNEETLIKESKWEELLEEIFRSEYPLDGIVIKATNPEIIHGLNATEHHEKWQIAYKSPAERKLTKVVEIKNQVGRTGRVTGVAKVEPVELSGAMVTNVTLHNMQFVLNSAIDIGSTVELCRSGEVIPFITRVIPAKSPHNKRTYEIPENCPVCHQKLASTGKYLECINKDCPAKKSQSIEYFFKSLGVEELGLRTIERLTNELGLVHILDFYNVPEENIAKLDGFGEKSAKNIKTNILSTLHESITENQLLKALGIKEIGPASSKWIINKYGFDHLPNLTTEELESVKGIGKSKAISFINDIREKWEIVESLMKLGLKFKKQASRSKLIGLSFAITGKKGKYSREELIKMIEDNGGEYKTSITKGLNYLIAGDDAGSKLEKAKELGIKVITDMDFVDIVE